MIAGACTTYLLPERLTTPVSAGDVTIAGLLAGVIGAILATALSQILAMPRGVNVADAINDLIGQKRMPPEMTGALEQIRDMPAAVFIIDSLLVTLFIILAGSDAVRARRFSRSDGSGYLDTDDGLPQKLNYALT